MDANQEIIDVKETNKQKFENAKKLWFCILNNSLILGAAVLMFCLLIVGIKSSTGKTIAIQNFYIYILNMFKTEWNSFSKVISLLADAGLAIAYLSVMIIVIIKLIKAIDAFVKICKKGYASIDENRIKDALGNLIKAYVVLSIVSSIFFPQKIESIYLAFLVISYIVILASDFLDNFYFDKKRSYRVLIYCAVRKAVIMICYTILVNYAMQLASVKAFLNGISLSSIFGAGIDASYIVSLIISLFIVPIFYFITQIMILNGFGASSEVIFYGDGNFTKLIVILSISCGVFIFGGLFGEAELSDNIFEYAYTIARKPLSAILVAIAGKIINSAYNVAIEEEKEKERVKENEKEKESLEKEKAEQKAEIEENEKKVTKQIAQAIVEAQNQAKDEIEAEKMAKIISVAIGKLNEENSSAKLVEGASEQKDK